MLLLAALALAGNTLTGSAVRVAYNDAGTWNDATVGSGLQVLVGQDWVEMTYAGYAYTMFAVAYSAGEDEGVYWANSALGNNILVLDSADESAGDLLQIRTDYATPDLAVRKTESFSADGRGVVIRFHLENTGVAALSDLRLAFAVDPDPDVVATGAYETLNDAVDLDGDGGFDWALSSGAATGAALGLGSCAPSQSEAGHFSDWTTVTDPDMLLSDGAGTSGDWAAGVRWLSTASLAPGESVSMALVVGTGGDGSAALESVGGLCCDIDGDGFDGAACGGDDCDDEQPAAFPGGTDTPYDGIDGDCVGGDDDDLDGDGFIGEAAGGDDCDDGDAEVNPGAEEVWHDGVDQDCDGQEDDEDGDGYSLARDCDDTDPAVFEDCPKDDGGPVSTEGDCGCSGTGTVPPTVGLFAAMVLAGRRRRP